MIEFDQATIGREFQAESPIEVTAEMIANFCYAIGEVYSFRTNPDGMEQQGVAEFGTVQHDTVKDDRPQDAMNRQIDRVGDGAAGSHQGLIAPPSFAGIFRLTELTFEKLPHGSRRLAAGMEIDFIAPIRAGDRITMTSRIKEVYEKTGRTGAMVFMVIGSTLRNQHGERVAQIEHRFMHRQ